MVLSAALLWPVTFPGGQTVNLSFSPLGPTDLYTHYDPNTYFNPQHSYAAVRRCWSAGVKAEGCEIFLVHPHLGARPLPQGKLRGLPRIKWTPDGQYLIAYGDDWLRLWNLKGAVRGLTPAVEHRSAEQILGRSIERVQFKRHLLCLTTIFDLGTPVYASPEPVSSSAPPSPSRTIVAQQAYVWPMLQEASLSDQQQCQTAK